MNEEYEILSAICQQDNGNLYTKYRQLKSLFERLCTNLIQDENLQMTDLAARISFISVKLKLTQTEQHKLHSFRIRSNNILNHQQDPDEEDLLFHIKTIAYLIKTITKEDIPFSLLDKLPKTDKIESPRKDNIRFIPKMKVCYQYADNDYLYATRTDVASSQLVRIAYKPADIIENFFETCSILWVHAQLNLLDVNVDKDDILIPNFIVLEPDYLINISTLAECYKDYGNHPANFLLSRLSSIGNSRALLLGNFTNLFLDEWVHSKGDADYNEVMKKAFRAYPLEILTCDELQDESKQYLFFRDCKTQFENIRRTTNNTFLLDGYDLNKNDAIVEPSIYCEDLGLQGRLDYLQQDISAFIEMKSGKADEFTIRGKIIPKENNLVQMLLYQAMLQYSLKKDHSHVRPFLLYTRYPLLYPAHSSWKKLKQIINLRNQIISNEYQIQHHKDITFTAKKLSEISADTLKERDISINYWTIVRQDIDNLQNRLNTLSTLEKHYFYTVYDFITNELYTSKSGDGDVNYEGRHGESTLWLSTLEEKKESGEILYDLLLKSYDGEHLLFNLEDKTLLPNFRNGDAVILYQREDNDDNITNQLSLKATIEYIDNTSLSLVLRTPQHTNILSADKRYAIEHDIMDSSYYSMFHGLAHFLDADPHRKALYLSQRFPDKDTSYNIQYEQIEDDFKRINLKALSAKDYFLLMGPPGTGKTSHALKQMVETFLSTSSDAQILLMAYTNRAVDEICKAIENINPTPDYIRIGHRLSCDKLYRGHLLSNRMESISNRETAYKMFQECHIYIGTISSISDKNELFKLKHFDAAIIDEASQILEPQLLNILYAKNTNGENAISKFVLIGDYKQLPAIILQKKEQSAVNDNLLNKIGIHNLNESLFERLYRYILHSKNDLRYCFDMLTKQGRMNPEVASFSNKTFYGNKLEIVGLPHQCDALKVSPTLKPDNYSHLMLQRVAYIPSECEPWDHSAKINHSEASIVKHIAQKVYEQYLPSFKSDTTLGIIAPYRSQIALIKHEITSLGIEALNQITIDTVERFQGSERDVIIYSFCVNHAYQLNFLSNIIQEDNVLIDRKLNVVLTRAKKQLFMTGVPQLLELNPIYKSLLKDVVE